MLKGQEKTYKKRNKPAEIDLKPKKTINYSRFHKENKHFRCIQLFLIKRKNKDVVGFDQSLMCLGKIIEQNLLNTMQ